ncbi:histidinol-phosphate transaminase [Sporolituus thermophilus]|uniref:Histidinol-phosphate aminotransferase n=1 Tax=Sporolituus thermophilus DSM 23256 TaxID=1123285 RepID=A0A1G7MM18_9FIRM|nr:histidinol-phosphate transaminase [Sporolituus thermophilus]SDF62845.1 histidinol-phosphate aminotransferase [Sporolituus thermophilus DSM 23256]
MTAIHIEPRPAVHQLRAFTPDLPDRTVGELRRLLGLDEVIKLSFNESPYGPSPRVAEALQQAARYVHWYHDPEGKELREKLAARYGVGSEQIFLANGADEAITLIAQAYLSPGDEAVIPAPTFGACAFSTRLVGATPVFVPVRQDLAIDLAAMAQAVTPRTKLVYLCNPNNPTGMMTGGDELRRFVAGLPEHVVVLIDEAYAEFVTDPAYLSGISLLPDHANVVAVRTFSKIYGMAALRLGYGIARPELVATVNRVRNPFNVNFLAHMAALAALADDDFHRLVAARNAEQRRRLTDAFTAMGWQVCPSQTNFLFADTGQDSAALCLALARQGIIIRPGHGWQRPSFVRITVGSPEQNDKLLAALRQLCGQ